MQVQVQTGDHIEGSEAMNRWIETETRERLARFRDHLTRVEIHFADQDASRSNGADKRCNIEARAAGRPPLAVNADAGKLPEAFTAAIDKLARALDTDLGRLRDRAGRETIRTAESDLV